MKTHLFLFFLLMAFIAHGQDITWTEITDNYETHSSIRVFKGERSDPALEIWYMDIDMNDPTIGIRPYYGGANIVPSLTQWYGAYAAVNGGYFGGGASYSTVLEPGVLGARNVSALTRNGKVYPVMRSFFSYTRNRSFGIDWIYHFNSDTTGIYRFNSPMPYGDSSSEPIDAPLATEGEQMKHLWSGVGGGPTLLKADTINVTYNQEIFWGSGVGRDNPDPRTAVGYTADNHVILLVADGRKSGVSEGVSLPELAEIMKNLGCTEAMNLDGGGSSQMAIGNEYVNNPLENRSVPVILAVVHKDSMKMPGEPDFQEIIDTEDERAEAEGSGWIETANDGFYGQSKSLINGVGDGSSYITYRVEPPAGVYSEVYGWWVASSNRSGDTPYIIKHQYGTDTVRVNQTANGSQWHLIGKYVFAGDGSDYVRISNQATTGSYVVADAVKVISFMEQDATAISDANEASWPVRVWPNPVGDFLHVAFTNTQAGPVQHQIYDSMGRRLRQKQQITNAGPVTVQLNVSDLPKGLYFYQLRSAEGRHTKKIFIQ